MAKSFTHWLVKDRRTPFEPLVHVSRLNVRTDRRHDRRALSEDEFTRLVEAARNGGRVAKPLLQLHRLWVELHEQLCLLARLERRLNS